MRKIYLDYAATTPVDPVVEKAMRPYFTKKFGNPGSLHFFGQEAMAAVDDSREKIAKAIGADFRQIIFTGSATEANNLALRGALKAISIRPRLIISAIEHESILETAKDLEKEGVEVIYLPVNKEGLVDLKTLKSALNERTILVSIMYANNEIGTIQPIQEISKIVKEFNPKILFHTDAVQAFQYLDCDVNELGVDLMTLSAHKIYGPKGIGALYVREANEAKKLTKLKAIITGGGQEFGLRSGTENVSLIVGFAKAVELISNSRELENKRIKGLRDYFWEQIKKGDSKIELNGGEPRLPNNLNIYWPGHDAQDLLVKFDLAGLAVSSGSACSARSIKSSHVLRALSFPDDRREKRIKQSVRFTLGRPTSKAELNHSIKEIGKILKYNRP